MATIISKEIYGSGPYYYHVEYVDGEQVWTYLGKSAEVDDPDQAAQNHERDLTLDDDVSGEHHTVDSSEIDPEDVELGEKFDNIIDEYGDEDVKDGFRKLAGELGIEKIEGLSNASSISNYNLTVSANSPNGPNDSYLKIYLGSSSSDLKLKIKDGRYNTGPGEVEVEINELEDLSDRVDSTLEKLDVSRIGDESDIAVGEVDGEYIFDTEYEHREDVKSAGNVQWDGNFWVTESKSEADVVASELDECAYDVTDIRDGVTERITVKNHDSNVRSGLVYEDEPETVPESTIKKTVNQEIGINDMEPGKQIELVVQNGEIVKVKE